MSGISRIRSAKNMRALRSSSETDRSAKKRFFRSAHKMKYIWDKSGDGGGQIIGDDLSRGIKFEEDFLRAYLISTNYEIDIAFWKILNFLRLRENHEYFFRNVSFDFTQYEDYRFVSKLPHRLKDGSATVVFQLGKWNPDIVPLEILKQIIFMVHVQELRNPMTQASGFNIIYDFKDSGFRHLKYGTPYNLRLIHDVSFEALPARFLGFHMININSIGRILLALARPFLPQYVEKIFYTHSSLKELLNYYPVSMLPVEYGGNLTDYYPDDWIRNANKEHGNFPLGGLKNIF
ncbi:Alpha-tocopherol transfer protein-like [Argiope bruennichi]|uniref:Alpha-tocopherol transfer protein-like n=1 Tax=Argiope bruennichi TaxID=94029 RepID=A0A8T0ERK2_ARGBR|nr:Alpha-tocopherol transfer protein-like [Argiope bruennichi]